MSTSVSRKNKIKLQRAGKYERNPVTKSQSCLLGRRGTEREGAGAPTLTGTPGGSAPIGKTKPVVAALGSLALYSLVTSPWA